MAGDIKPNSKLRIEAEHLVEFSSVSLLDANGALTGQQWNFTAPVTVTLVEDHTNGTYTVQMQEDGDDNEYTFKISELDFFLLDVTADELGIGFEGPALVPIDNNVVDGGTAGIRGGVLLLQFMIHLV